MVAALEVGVLGPGGEWERLDVLVLERLRLRDVLVGDSTAVVASETLELSSLLGDGGAWETLRGVDRLIAWWKSLNIAAGWLSSVLGIVGRRSWMSPNPIHGRLGLLLRLVEGCVLGSVIAIRRRERGVRGGRGVGFIVSTFRCSKFRLSSNRPLSTSAIKKSANEA
jgi:hypothetical protein